MQQFLGPSDACMEGRSSCQIDKATVVHSSALYGSGGDTEFEFELAGGSQRTS